MKESNTLLTTLTDNESSLLQFLTRSVGCPHKAADIFQNMAEKLLGAKDASAIANQQAYLFRVARNEVINHFRFEQRRHRHEAESASIGGELDDRDAERIAIADESLQVLNQALDELPQLTRHIFILYRVDGMRQKDVATQLGLSLSTVEKHLANAMKYCRIRLREGRRYGIHGPQTSPRYRK